MDSEEAVLRLRYAVGVMNKMGLLVLLVSGASSLLAQGACLSSIAQQAAGQVHERQNELLRQKINEMDTTVPPALKPQIHALKDALADAVDDGMRCAAVGESAAVTEAALAKLLGANQPDKPVAPSTPSAGSFDNQQDGTYGAMLKVAVAAPQNAAQMRVVTVGFGIECGDDTMLFVYEPRPAGWRRTLRWQSDAYDEVSGAFGDFLMYAVLPGTNEASWKIAVAHGTTWCTSRWSGFKLDLLAPGSDAPRVVWHTEHGLVLETAPRMTARADGFDFRADVGTIETEQLVRKGIFRYRVEGDTVERVQPIAVDGRGFVDAWLQAPWSEAKQWSLAEGLAGFEKVHEAFARGRKDSSVGYNYGPVRGCLMQGRYEVEMDATPGGPQFYAIKQGQNGYTMVNFSTTQDERCNGPDLMKKR
jgi:hypothetical protein